MNPTQQGSTLRRYLLPVFSRASPLPPPSFALLTRKCTILLKYQNALFAGLAIRSLLPQHEKNAFLEAVACICERREWRDYASGMYDDTNFVKGGTLKGMAAAFERFREHERMSYHCVGIAMEYLSKKNFSGTAVEYCGRVLGISTYDVTDNSRCILLLSWGCCAIGSCTQCCNTVHGSLARRNLRGDSITRLVPPCTTRPFIFPQTSP